MSRIHCAHASGPDWGTALGRALDGLGDDGRRAALGLCYLADSPGNDADALLSFLRQRSRVAHWAGTVGAGVCGDGIEYFDAPAAAVMTFDLPAEAFRVFHVTGADGAGLDPGLAQWIDAAAPRFGIVHGDPRNPAVESLVAGLSTRLGGGFLVGGLSGARRGHFQIADAVVEGGLSGVLFSSDVTVSTRLSQGCTPVGPRHRVGRASGSVVFTLDGRPALEVLTEDLAALEGVPPSAIAGLIHVAIPVTGSDTGDYMVRNLLGIDPDQGAIGVGENIDSVEQLMFCRRDAVSASTDLDRMLGELKKDIAKKPEGALYYSCIARGPNLFGPESKELKRIQATLGSLPLAGFFGNGEISNDRLYGYTGVLTLFL